MRRLPGEKSEKDCLLLLRQFLTLSTDDESMSNDTAAINESVINGFVNVSLGAIGLVANLTIVVCFVRVPRVRTVNCAYLIASIALTDIIFSELRR